MDGLLIFGILFLTGIGTAVLNVIAVVAGLVNEAKVRQWIIWLLRLCIVLDLFFLGMTILIWFNRFRDHQAQQHAWGNETDVEGYSNFSNFAVLCVGGLIVASLLCRFFLRKQKRIG